MGKEEQLNGDNILNKGKKISCDFEIQGIPPFGELLERLITELVNWYEKCMYVHE